MTVVTAILLGLGVAIAAWSTLGMVRARDPFARFHYMSPVSTLATLLVCAAIVTGGLGGAAIAKAVLVFLITALASPAAQQMMARAIWVRRHGRWQLPAPPPPGEDPR